jgi:hypothetical protein
MSDPQNEININTPEVNLAFARMEAKLDVALALHGAKLEQHTSDIASLDDDINALDVRLRTVESTPTVSPRTLGAVVIGGAGVLGALFPFLDKLYS